MSEKQNRQQLSRRDALKVIAAVTGAATLTNLPNKWVKPVLDAGVLPAHAQTTPTPQPPNSFVVKAFWTDGNNDVDLILEEPDGTRVHPALDGATGTYTTWSDNPPREETTLTTNAPASQTFKVFGLWRGFAAQGANAPTGILPENVTFQVFTGTVADPATMQLNITRQLTSMYSMDGSSNTANSTYVCDVAFLSDGTIIVTTKTGAITPPL
ncbi:MAG: twin-arginine translocation signal domain-containing protein [Candidatus Thermofonsia bacterium]|nr:MAG: twin-arginine translocation signal domain-containing protein [Candidatus Thermofonsia bacterium]